MVCDDKVIESRTAVATNLLFDSSSSNKQPLTFIDITSSWARASSISFTASSEIAASPLVMFTFLSGSVYTSSSGYSSPSRKILEEDEEEEEDEEDEEEDDADVAACILISTPTSKLILSY